MRESRIKPAYGKVRDAAVYVGMSERTMRDLLKDGLPHFRVRGGNILVKFDELDDWMSQWRTSTDQAGIVVDGLFKEVLNA